MRYLLDVNVMLAAIWKGHSEHAKANAWLEGKDVATCPLTELGFLRISTNSRALKSEMTSARKLLQEFVLVRRAAFIPADMRALDSSPSKSEQVTDSYLADLAAKKGFKLATLDSGISHAAVEQIG